MIARDALSLPPSLSASRAPSAFLPFCLLLFSLMLMRVR